MSPLNYQNQNFERALEVSLREKDEKNSEEAIKISQKNRSIYFLFGHKYSKNLNILPAELIYTILNFKHFSNKIDSTIRTLEFEKILLTEHNLYLEDQLNAIKYQLKIEQAKVNKKARIVFSKD